MPPMMAAIGIAIVALSAPRLEIVFLEQSYSRLQLRLSLARDQCTGTLNYPPPSPVGNKTR